MNDIESHLHILFIYYAATGVPFGKLFFVETPFVDQTSLSAYGAKRQFGYFPNWRKVDLLQNFMVRTPIFGHSFMLASRLKVDSLTNFGQRWRQELTQYYSTSLQFGKVTWYLWHDQLPTGDTAQ